MKIAVASGKGGTGKTTLSVSLAEYIMKSGYTVSITDCDVEEPNSALFLEIKNIREEKVFVDTPELNKLKCIGCGTCEEICKFSAIAMVNEIPLIFNDLCHSCGGCVLVCATGAISYRKVSIGIFQSGTSGTLYYSGGELDIGKIQTTHLISHIREELNKRNTDFKIIDSPPGTSCPMVETVKGCDHLMLVAEPTPFSLNDLKISIEAARAMGLDFSVIINKNDLHSDDNPVLKYCLDQGIDVPAVIPWSDSIALAYSSGDFRKLFTELYSSELEKVMIYLKNKIITRRKNERDSSYKR